MKDSTDCEGYRRVQVDLNPASAFCPTVSIQGGRVPCRRPVGAGGQALPYRNRRVKFRPRPARTLLAAALLVTAAAGCQRRSPAPAPPPAEVVAGPQQETWGARFLLDDQGRPRLHLDAPYLAHYDQADTSYMQLTGTDAQPRVTAQLFDAEGDSSAVVTADQMLYYDRRRRFEARGAVVVVTPEGRRLETEHLVWDEDAREVRSPGFVRITTPEERIEGYGLVADEDLAAYRLGRVTGQVLVDDA